MGRRRAARSTTETPNVPRSGWISTEVWRKPGGDPTSSAQSRRLTYGGTDAYEPLAFGKSNDVGGVIVKWEGISGGRVIVRYLVSIGELGSTLGGITNIRVGGQPITSICPLLAQNYPSGSNISAGHQVYLGTPNQPVSAIMSMTTGWIPTRYPGRAYVAVVFPPPVEGQAPLDISDFKCDVTEGIKVRDYAQDTTLTNRYPSEDPVCIIEDLITSKRYGGREPDSKINWSLANSFSSSYTMETISAGIKRYPVGFVIRTQQDLESLIKNIGDHAQLFISPNSGKYNILVDKPRAHTGITINDTHIIGTPSVYSKGSADVYDSLEIGYIDSEDKWTQKSTPIESPDIHNSNEPTDPRSIDLLGTRYLQQAKRIGIYHFNKSQRNLIFTVPVNEIGAMLLPNDRIFLTSSDLNVSNLDVYCKDVILNSNGWLLVLELYDETIYSNAIVTNLPPVRPANPSPNDTPNPPTSLVLTEVIQGQDSRVKISFVPAVSSHLGQFTRIKVRRTVSGVVGDWFKLNDTTGSVDYILNTNPGELYEFELKTVTIPPFNKESTPLTGSITTTGVNLTGPPGASAKTLIVISDRQTITYDETGAVNPASQTTTFTAQKQNTTAVVNWSATRVDGAAISPITNLLSSATGDSVTMSAANFNTQRGSTEGVIIMASLTDGTTITDRISVVRVQRGATGSTGATGPIGPIGPANFTLNTQGVNAVLFGPNSAGKVAGAESIWDSGVYSTEGYTRGVFVSFKPNQVSHNLMVGLNTDPITDANFSSIDYAWYCSSVGNIDIYESGISKIGLTNTYTVNDTFSITYDGYFVRYFKNGVLIRSVARNLGSPLYLDSSFHANKANAQISNISFGPMGEQGTPASTLLANPNSAAAVGGRLLIAPTTKVASEMTIFASSIIVESNIFSNNDIIVLQKVLSSGTQQTEFLRITSAAAGVGPYTYSVSRNLGGHTITDSWMTNDPVVSLGQTSNSFVDMYSVRGLKSSSEVGPSLVGNIRNSATYNDWSPRWAIGNLNGLYGYSTNIFGAAFGVPSAAWLKIDSTNGVRIGYNTSSFIQIDAAGNASFSGSIDILGTLNVGGNLYLGTKLTWNGTTLSVDGVINSVSGTIGGFTIFANRLESTALVVSQDGTISSDGNIGSSNGFNAFFGATYKVNNIQVVGAQGAAVANATNSTDVVTRFNEWLSRARAHGLIAT